MTIERINVHGSSAHHDDCPDPAKCDCACRACKRAWEAAGRPSPALEPLVVQVQAEPGDADAEEALLAKYG